jgi:hypothetical protein
VKALERELSSVDTDIDEYDSSAAASWCSNAERTERQRHCGVAGREEHFGKGYCEKSRIEGCFDGAATRVIISAVTLRLQT